MQVKPLLLGEKSQTTTSEKDTYLNFPDNFLDNYRGILLSSYFNDIYVDSVISLFVENKDEYLMQVRSSETNDGQILTRYAWAMAYISKKHIRIGTVSSGYSCWLI